MVTACKICGADEWMSIQLCRGCWEFDRLIEAMTKTAAGRRRVIEANPELMAFVKAAWQLECAVAAVPRNHSRVHQALTNLADARDRVDPTYLWITGLEPR